MDISSAKFSLESFVTQQKYNRDLSILIKRGNKGHIHNQPSQKYSWHLPRLQISNEEWKYCKLYDTTDNCLSEQLIII